MRRFILFTAFIFFSCRYESKILFEQPESIHTHSARLFLQKKKYGIALEELKQAHHSQPGNLKVAVKLAEMFYRNNQPHKTLDMLLPFQTSASRTKNVFYYIGLAYEQMGNYKDSYLYYKKAFKLDPTHYKAKLKIAQLFIKKGLYFDAAIHLKNLLEIKPDYRPAQIEFELTLRLIKENKHNIFRRGNLVVTFPDYNLIRDIEDWYPYLQEKIYYLQNALGHNKSVVWVKIVDKIKSPYSPPALYNSKENKIYLTVDTLQRKYTSLFTHELTYMFFHQMKIRKAPQWLKEGIALYFSRPNMLKHISLRRLGTNWDVMDKRFYPDKRYLHFSKLTDNQKKDLFQAFLIAKFLVKRYGWDNIERFVKSFEKGRQTIEEVVWDVFHIKYRRLISDFDTYITVHHFFNT